MKQTHNPNKRYLDRLGQRLPAVFKTLAMGLLAALFLGAGMALAENRPEDPRNYTALLDFIQMEDRKGPLVEFRQTSGDVDSDLSRENRRFISQNEALLGKIRTELNSEELQWRLIEATKRLMVVPESHSTYAALFESYCRSVVNYVLRETALPNPYRAIATLANTPTELAPSGDGGITAYLVHNIADVYTEEYAFFDAHNEDRSVRIKLDNRVYLGEIGSYSSYLVIDEGPRYTFEHNPYTLWRNSANNPFNVFIAPIEETLHIALRGATEKAIKNRLGESPPGSLSDVEAVVEEWMAVEEAAVGGLVSVLLPGIFERFLEAGTITDMEETFAERREFDKYRFLDQGIAIASELGLHSVIQMYQEQPRRFKSLLTPALPDVVEEPGDRTAEAPSSEPAA